MPPGVVTAILPVLTADGTVALIRVASTTLNTADAPLNVTRSYQRSHCP